jgi:hypothetical protein
VATSQDCYIYYVSVVGSHLSAVDGLANDVTSVFPAEFYRDFGLESNVGYLQNDAFYKLGSGAHVDCTLTGQNERKGFELALFLDPNHQANSYLPDRYNNSGEQYLAQAIAYYVGQYLQSH